MSENLNDQAEAFAMRYHMDKLLVMRFMQLSMANPEIAMVLGRVVANSFASGVIRIGDMNQHNSYLSAVKGVSDAISALTLDAHTGIEIKSHEGVEGVLLWGN